MKSGVMVQSIERAIKIMQCFTQQRPELRLKDIADELNLNKSTVHGILNTLKHYGFVEQSEGLQQYRLGLSLLALGSQVLSSLDVRSAAGPVISEVCVQTGETVHLVLLEGMDVVYIDKQESNQSIRIFTSIGTRYRAYATGVGKAMLAYQSLEELMAMLPAKLEKLTEHTITDKEELIEQLVAIRGRGYAIDDEETLIGLRCVAAPIFNYRNQVVSAISISGPSVRMTPERLPELTELVCQAAKRISRNLGQRE